MNCRKGIPIKLVKHFLLFVVFNQKDIDCLFITNLYLDVEQIKIFKLLAKIS